MSASLINDDVTTSLLDCLKGSHAQAPKSVDDLATATGMQNVLINAALDKLYASRQINQANVIKYGISARMVWLPLAINSIKNNPYRNFTINPAKTLAATAKKTAINKDTLKMGKPLITEEPPQNETYEIPAFLRKDAPEIDTNANMKKIRALPGEPFTKAWLVLKAIEANPNINTSKIRVLTDVSDAYNFIKPYINRGLIIVDKNEVLPRYSMAAGVTAKYIHQVRYEKTTTKPTKTVKPQSKDEASKPLINGQIETLKAVPEPAKSGDFRVAYTNDGCLMLLGLQTMPIELNAAQTNDLIDFISEQINPIGVEI